MEFLLLKLVIDCMCLFVSKYILNGRKTYTSDTNSCICYKIALFRICWAIMLTTRWLNDCQLYQSKLDDSRSVMFTV